MSRTRRSFLSRWFSGPQSSKQQKRRRFPRRPLEALEDRRLLSISSLVEDMEEVTANEDSQDIILDLRKVFQTDLDEEISFSVTSNTSIATATFYEWALRLEFPAEQFGNGSITVRAADSSGYLDKTFAVNVAEVNDWPQVEATDIPFWEVNEGEDFDIDLSQYFSDVDTATLTYSVGLLDQSSRTDDFEFDPSFNSYNGDWRSSYFASWSPDHPLSEFSVNQQTDSLHLDLNDDAYGYIELAYLHSMATIPFRRRFGLSLNR